MRGEGVPFDVDLDESQPFRVERRPGYLDRAVEVPISLFCFEETSPQEAVAVSRVLAVVPAPQVPDGSVWISGYPIDQGLGRAEGLSELLPDHDDIRDWWPARSR
jgi:hypothetical protein